MMKNLYLTDQHTIPQRNVNRDFLYIIYLFEIMTAPDSEEELEIQWNVYKADILY